MTVAIGKHKAQQQIDGDCTATGNVFNKFHARPSAIFYHSFLGARFVFSVNLLSPTFLTSASYSKLQASGTFPELGVNKAVAAKLTGRGNSIS